MARKLATSHEAHTQARNPQPDHADTALERASRRNERLTLFVGFLGRLRAAVFKLSGLRDILDTICIEAVADDKFLLAWAGVVDPAGDRVVPVTTHGAAAGYVNQVGITTDPHMATSHGPTRISMVEQRIVYIDDFLTDPATAPWRPLAREYGLKSSVSFPIVLRGETRAVLNLYSGETAYFDPEFRTLLEAAVQSATVSLEIAETEHQASLDQQARRRSEERFRLAFDASPIPVQIYSLSTMTIQYANRANERVLGYTFEDMAAGASWFEKIVPDPALLKEATEIYEANVRAAAAGGSSTVMTCPELPIRCRDGSERIARASLSVVGDDIVLQWEDLTAIRRSQAKAQESERRLRQAFDASPVPVQIYSRSTLQYRYANHANERVFGYGAGDVPDVAALLERIFPDPALRARMLALFQADVEKATDLGPSQVVVSPEIIMRRRDGIERTIQGSMTVVGDDIVLQWEDLTEIKAAQRQAEISELNFRRIIEQNLLGIYVTVDDRLVYANPRLCQILGMAEADLIGRDSMEFIGQGAEQRQKILTARAALRSVGQSEPLTGSFRRPDGREILLRFHGANGVWSGRPAIIAMVEDITERQRAADALAASQQRLRETLDGLLEGCAIIGFDWRYLYVNRMAAVQGREEPEAILGRTLLEIYPALEGTEIYERYQRVMETRAGEKFEASFTFKGGDTAWFRFSVDPAPEGIVVLRHDITESRRTRAELDRQVRLLAEMSAVASIGAWEIELEPRQVTWSDETARIHDLPENTAVEAAEALEYYLGEHRQVVRDAFRAAVDRAEPFDLELSIVTATGRHKWVRIIGHVETVDGKACRVHGSLQDITRRKEAETALSDSYAFNQAVLDSVDTEIAVLDHDGIIIAVNEPWRRFARENAGDPDASDLPPSVGVGANYLEVCRTASSEPGDSAGAVVEGIRSVLEGRAASYQAEYPCHSPTQDRWFAMTVTPLESGARGAVAAHTDITERRRAEDAIAHYVSQLEHTMRGTLEAVATMVEQRDPYTAGHERRVGVLASDIAREMGCSEVECQNLQLIGLVHDIGKIGIPAEILSKPSRLTPIEYMLVQNHAEQGYQVLRNVDFPLPIADIIRQHHERMDGSGYPKGLKGDAILPEARILAVADVVESISSHRPYRPALGVEAALEEIETHRGVLFDGAVVDACLRLFRERGYALPA